MTVAPLDTGPPLLSVEGLRIGFGRGEAATEAVRGVSLSLAAGERLALVGESGSGKSQTAMACVGLLDPAARSTGSIRLDGEELLGLSERRWNTIRGARIGMVFQDPLSCLAPHLTIGEQIAAPLRAHRGLSRRAAEAEARAWLERVRIASPAQRLRQYPHELSGGMRQRVMIASALACGPKLLIADEPTTALDVTVQAEILALLDELRAQTATALLLITHDLGVVARMADRVCVMRDGLLVEQGGVEQVLGGPAHPYTRRLLDAAPRLDGRGRSDRVRPLTLDPEAAHVLRVDDLTVRYPIGRRWWKRGGELRAVDGVCFALRRGETIGVVGESGSGKSSLARAALRLAPASGAVTFLGAPLPERECRALRRARRDLQVVFQDPQGSLDPRMTVEDSIAEPLRVHRPQLGRTARRAEVAAWLERVDLAPGLSDRYPHQLSGGQAQRVGIARAMILKPSLLVCDEATSALDVSVRAQILDLIVRLQGELGTAILFIGHDLAVIREVSHRVLVMKAGRVVEEGPADALLDDPQQPYTRALIAAVLSPDPAAHRRAAGTSIAPDARR